MLLEKNQKLLIANFLIFKKLNFKLFYNSTIFVYYL